VHQPIAAGQRADVHGFEHRVVFREFDFEIRFERPQRSFGQAV